MKIHNDSYFYLFFKGILQPKCQPTSICSLLGVCSAVSTFVYQTKFILVLNDSFNFHKRQVLLRDETSHTATPGPYSPNDYLQYGVSHADDIYYLFKVSCRIDQNPLSLQTEHMFFLQYVDGRGNTK